jgi:hypothetical protein
MTRLELTERLALAITAREGFFDREAQAKAQGPKLSTRARRSADLGNVGE